MNIYEAWFPTLVELTLRVFGNGAMEKWRNVCNRSFRIIIKVTGGCDGQGMQLLRSKREMHARSLLRCEDNIELNLKEIDYKVMNLVELAKGCI